MKPSVAALGSTARRKSNRVQAGDHHGGPLSQPRRAPLRADENGAFQTDAAYHPGRTRNRAQLRSALATEDREAQLRRLRMAVEANRFDGAVQRDIEIAEEQAETLRKQLSQAEKEAEEVTRRKARQCTLVHRIHAREEDRYNLIVLGAGPVGVKAAVEAASRGQRVALLDPSDLIHGAPTGAHSKCLREAALAGVSSWDKVQQLVKRACENASHQTMRELKTFHVELLRGSGTVHNSSQVSFAPTNGIAPRNLAFDAPPIATGSSANRFPPVDFDVPGVFDSDTIWSLNRLPRRVVVQGAGIIGLEYAMIFAKFGAEVTVVEVADKVVPMMDVALQEGCKASLRKFGIQIHLRTPIKSMRTAEDHTPEAPSLLVDIGSYVVPCDCVLSACGRHGNTQGLGLEVLKPLGLKVGRGRFLEVDENGWTGVAKIYAAGDVAGANLATAGQAQALRAARALFGSGTMSAARAHKPMAVWTIPEIGWAGLTEEQAVQSGMNVGTATALYKQSIRGCISNEDGLLKLVFDRESGRVLGVHIIGECAPELINYGAEVVNDGDTIFDMLQFVFPAVTYHCLYHHAASQAKARLKGAQSVGAQTVWRRITAAIKKSLENPDEGDSLEVAMNDAFHAFDDDNSGFVSAANLKAAMAKFDIQLDDAQIKEMIFEVTGDPEEDQLDYENFVGMLRSQARCVAA